MRDRHLALPIGLHARTRVPMTLAEALADSDVLADMAGLSYDDRATVALARWEAGDWEDLHYGTYGLVDLDRARAEVAARSDLGVDLLDFEAGVVRRTIELIREAPS